MGKLDAKRWYQRTTWCLIIYSTMILKLASNRINIHRAKKTDLSLKHKKEVADLLAQGKRDQARIMV